jgi:hypothetical protein
VVETSVKLRLIAGLCAVLGVLVVVYFVTRPNPEPSPVVPPKVWDLDFTELERVVIELPKRALSQAWVKHEDKQWYFDEPDGPEVSHDRWGGGIPVILSGPHASRAIAADVAPDQLAVYGLDEPAMRIELATEGGETVKIDVGDRTPSGDANYFRRIDSSADMNNVYSIDYTWYDILERLVTEPPY